MKNNVGVVIAILIGSTGVLTSFSCAKNASAPDVVITVPESAPTDSGRLSPVTGVAFRELANAVAKNPTGKVFAVEYTLSFTSGNKRKERLLYDRQLSRISMLSEAGRGPMYSNVTDGTIQMVLSTNGDFDDVVRYGAFYVPKDKR